MTSYRKIDVKQQLNETAGVKVWLKTTDPLRVNISRRLWLSVIEVIANTPRCRWFGRLEGTTTEISQYLKEALRDR